MDWNSSALWGIIGLIGGIVISAFFYFLGIKRKFYYRNNPHLKYDSEI